MLFILQLFFALPHYIPEGPPIIFSCVLGEEVVKNIELTNPSSKPISYWVKKEGHSDFSLMVDEFTIEPKKPYDFKVKFTSRVF